MTMPDRNAHIHGDEGTYDPEPYRQRALDDVIETIMLFGQYPQPRTGHGWHNAQRRVEFDLQEWIVENMEPIETAAFLVAHISGYENRDIMQSTFEKLIEAALRAHLADSDMVMEKIEELHEDEREEHNGR